MCMIFSSLIYSMCLVYYNKTAQAQIGDGQGIAAWCIYTDKFQTSIFILYKYV